MHKPPEVGCGRPSTSKVVNLLQNRQYIARNACIAELVVCILMSRAKQYRIIECRSRLSA